MNETGSNQRCCRGRNVAENLSNAKCTTMSLQRPLLKVEGTKVGNARLCAKRQGWGEPNRAAVRSRAQNGKIVR